MHFDLCTSSRPGCQSYDAGSRESSVQGVHTSELTARKPCSLRAPAVLRILYIERWAGCPQLGLPLQALVSQGRDFRVGAFGQSTSGAAAPVRELSYPQFRWQKQDPSPAVREATDWRYEPATRAPLAPTFKQGHYEAQRKISPCSGALRHWRR